MFIQRAITTPTAFLLFKNCFRLLSDGSLSWQDIGNFFHRSRQVNFQQEKRKNQAVRSAQTSTSGQLFSTSLWTTRSTWACRLRKPRKTKTSLLWTCLTRLKQWKRKVFSVLSTTLSCRWVRLRSRREQQRNKARRQYQPSPSPLNECLSSIQTSSMTSQRMISSPSDNQQRYSSWFTG